MAGRVLSHVLRLPFLYLVWRPRHSPTRSQVWRYAVSREDAGARLQGLTGAAIAHYLFALLSPKREDSM